MTIDLSSVEEALDPDRSFGYPTIIRPELEQPPWTEAAEYQKQVIDEVIAKSKDISLSRFAVFSLTPIPYSLNLSIISEYSIL